MSYLIDLKTFTDARKNLRVIGKTIPFEIKRVFYINGVDDSKGGGHQHEKAIRAAIYIRGSRTIYNHNGINGEKNVLNSPSKLPILETQEGHTMFNFSKDAILMMFASEFYAERRLYI